MSGLLPRVSPAAARRRAWFLSLTSLLLVGVTVALLASRLGVSPLPGANLPEAGAAVGPAPAPASPCTLEVAGTPVGLSVALARQLTDQAGRDQNAAQPLTFTEAKVRVLWPSEAAQAEAVTRALRGYEGPALTCSATLGTAAVQSIGPDGLTPRAESVWNAVESIFGTLPAGGFKPGGVTTGHIPGSAHYEGRAIDYMYRPVTAKSIQHGWTLAQWLVAHAEALAIRTVIFDRKLWTPAVAGADGWRVYVVTHGQVEDPSLQHLDHVHVDVLRNTGA